MRVLSIMVLTDALRVHEISDGGISTREGCASVEYFCNQQVTTEEASKGPGHAELCNQLKEVWTFLLYVLKTYFICFKLHVYCK